MLLSQLRLSQRRRRPALRAFLTALVCWVNLGLNLGTGLAGDILRGAGVGPQSRGAAAAGNAPAAAVQAAVSGSDTLSRTTMALQAVRNLQAAARAAAQGNNNAGADPNHPGQMLPNVPNGLGVGGLQVAPGVPANPVLWQGANLPTQRAASGQTHVTITQTAQQAILNWQTFNIGKDTRLTFDQTAGGANATQWIAFNKVNDPSGVPSQILGSLDAIGQIYVINANGIIFGGNSQLNLHTLVASALPINDNLIARGLLNNPDNQFLFSALPLLAGQNDGGTPAFTPPASNTPNGNYGDITVQAGGQITSPSSADHVGGRVALIGANVDNEGTISTPDGQTVLAAGLQVGMAAHATTDPSLRGVDIYVGQVGDYAGTAVNGGLIDAPRADVTMAGKAVDQLGFINSTTSVTLNGRVDLLADYNADSFVHGNSIPPGNPPPFFFQSSGTVTLGPDSVTQIVPEYSSTERVVGSQLALTSQVNIQGLAVHEGSDAVLFAPSASISIGAGTWSNLVLGFSQASQFVSSGGQIYLDAGALIDVSGSQDINASVTENIVQAQLLGSELANSPLQRNGPLRGQTVFIDVNQRGTFNGQTWIGTALADVSGYVNLVQRTVGELTTNGGTVNLSAGESVVLQQGSAVNVSGGWINYAGGNVPTTQVISASGQVFDISQATPDRVYTGIVGSFASLHPKWGVTENFTSPLGSSGRFEAGYQQGGDGGSLTITAPSMALDGTLTGTTLTGARQQTSPPPSSSLSLVFQAQDPTAPLFLPISPTPPDIVFGNGSLAPADPFQLDSSGNPVALRADRKQGVLLSPDLVNADGFGNLTINNSDGSITLPANLSLTTSVGGSVNFLGANIDLEGAITSPGGTLAFTVYDFSPYQLAFLKQNPTAVTPTPDVARGHFVLGSQASLNASGMVTDLRPAAAVSPPVAYTANGGTVSIASYDVNLAQGSVIDVSGGATVSGTGTISYVKGGAVAILSGQDPGLPSLLGGQLSLDGSLAGYSGSIGGSLRIQAPLIQVGGTASDADTLLLARDFFNQGGFTSFTLTGLGKAAGQSGQFLPGVSIAPGTIIQPVAETLLANVSSQGAGVLTLSPTLLSAGVRAPVNLSFRTPGVRSPFSSENAVPVVRGDFVMGAGAAIQTDPLANVSISGDTAAISGSIITPGGNISITGGKSTVFTATPQGALVTVDLSPTSFLSTAGAVVLTPNALGLRTGSVLGGGNISVSGNIIAENGAQMDVSGTTGILDLAPSYSGGSTAAATNGAQFVPTRVDSSAGSISLSGTEELFTDASFKGAAGGPSALAGSLSLSSGRFSLSTLSPLDETLTVTQSGLTIPAPFYPAGQTPIGHQVVDSSNQPVAGLGYFAADKFNESGLASLTLQGTVRFSGPVTINAARSINVANGGVLLGDDAINLNAPYVAIGMAFAPPVRAQDVTNPFAPFPPFGPTYGGGSLNISASLIDVGNLSLQGIGSASLVATNGDVRGDGTFDIAGNLSITAGQIYPPTAVSFTLAAYDYLTNGTSHPGSITLAASGIRPLPLSGGGQLNIYSSVINDGGVLRAPLGTINIGWNGTGNAPTDLITGQAVPVSQQVNLSSTSVTSVSAIDPITGKGVVIPYGVDPNGTAWIDPAGNDITLSGPPAKSINISAANVSDQSGSTIDLRGGGDLYAYEFVSGTGGTVDILNPALSSSSSFAVISGNQGGYAPFGLYNTATSDAFGSSINPATGQTIKDPGYVSNGLSVGDQVYLNGSNGLPAGTYTLLPARYALLPGAFLITAQSGTPTTGLMQPDGSTLVSGYRFNGFDTPTARPVFSSFDVASGAVIRNRAQYNDFLANTYLQQTAINAGIFVPRLPIDSGHLLFDATQTLSIEGSLIAQAPSGGRGGLVDISSPGDILVGGSNATGAPGELVLDASALSAFGAESILIGGIRQTTTGGTEVTVSTTNITVDNSGASLTGPDIILAATNSLTLAPNADVEASGNISNAGTLLVNGNGALLRVSSDATANISRTGANPSQSASMVIAAGAKIAGAGLTIDSSSATSIDSSATITGTSVSIDSGQISVQLASVGNPSGLILSSATLSGLENNAQSISLLSYSSIDIYGAGDVGALDSSGNPTLVSLALHAGEIRGFDLNGGTVNFNAQTVSLDNSAGATGPGAVGELDGLLNFNAGVVRLGTNQLSIDQFASVNLNASNGVLFRGTGGLDTAGALTISTPLITGAAGAQATISSAGAVDIESPSGATAKVTGGLGANLTIQGAGVTENSSISLASGQLSLHATNGDVSVGGSLDVSGTAQTFFDLTKYTSGGAISLVADTGNVNLAAGSAVTVAAQPGGGDAGSLTISAIHGDLNSMGTLLGAGGTGGVNGTFSLDIGALPTLTSLSAQLNSAGFTQSRSIRVRTGDVTIDGTTTSHVFDLSADDGSINITGTIDASGATGGTIDLAASGSVVLSSGSVLTAAAQKFDDAGKGGAISLAAGSETNGTYDTNAVLDIQSGSTVNLSVAANTASSASLGNFTGTLHLRAPQTIGGTDLQMNPINGTVTGASSIVVEGYKIFNATDGSIDNQEANVFANGQLFGGNSAAISTRLLANNSSLAPITVISPGAEIINPNGDLTLGGPNSTSSSDWDLSTYRFGPNGAAGVLTLRASGNLIFYNALSDGFTSSAYNATLLAENSSLPLNTQSWSYRLTAGADFTAANTHDVQALSTLTANTGSLELGKDYGINVFGTSGPSASTSAAVSTRFQVIRTGTGDIDISAGRDVDLLNEFATIYTAGVLAPDQTLGGTFDTPIAAATGQSTGTLGAIQQSGTGYPVQYSFAGGNVDISAQGDIAHKTRTISGTLIDDSSRELPINWLYRRGYVDPTTGLFGRVTRTGNRNDVGSTTWWIDFSNFFEGVGALGGGNVTLTAGHDVSNVDAVAPTNARMPGKDALGNPIAPNAASLIELGGGDVAVRAGNDINGGVYYVERGQGTLAAGNSIHTNSTRSPSRTIIVSPSAILDPATWLPTTLFLGEGSFDVQAKNDVLLGPVANAFLLPEGVNNTFWYKTYFSTYAPTDAVNVSSLAGNVTFREAATVSGTSAIPILQAWLAGVSLLDPSGGTKSASFYQPWLRLDETDVSPFSTLVGLMPPTLRASAFSGDINVVGNMTLSPSPTGTVDLAAGGAINGLQANGVSTVQATGWAPSTINLSDADPSRVPGIDSPLAYRTTLSPANQTTATPQQSTGTDFLTSINVLFAETGSTEGAATVLQNEQALHAPGPLHADDPDPIHLYAGAGDISGFTVFSGKAARVVAGQDITDIAFYIQNDNPTDLTVIAAGRDLVAYDPNSVLRLAALAPGNVPESGPNAGDIQISGSGSLEVLAGRNLDLGAGPSNADGTGVGITSIGNARNPFLPFAGADIFAGAGIGISSSLANSKLNFATLITDFLDPTNSTGQSARYLPDLGSILGLTNPTSDQVWTAFQQLPVERQDQLALDIFYLVLRDAGRDHNDPSSPNAGKYDNGFAAIAALFPDSVKYQGDISLTAREIKTANGGNISIFAPGGSLNVGVNVASGQAADQGVLTQHGGDINIFTNNDVNVGTSRIFTLRGGNEIIWSSKGNIAAGSSSKTVLAAPPTRVLIDPQSGDVQTDLAGLATGGGIGVLESVVGVPPADVDLIAPVGTVNAGDAGIRVSGNINIAALIVLNAGNIQVGGSSSGIPAVAAPNLGSLTNASNSTAASSEAAAQIASQNTAPIAQEDTPSLISVEVIGYGGGDDQDEEERRRKKQQGERPQTSTQNDSVRLSLLEIRPFEAGSSL